MVASFESTDHQPKVNIVGKQKSSGMSVVPDYLMGTCHLIPMLVIYVRLINVSCQLIILIFVYSYAISPYQLSTLH
jgi:hypothetical protein